MKTDYTHISIVLDRSGSMGSVKHDTINGFNQFLADQKSQPGEATITLVQFDNEYEEVLRMTPLAQANPLTTSTFIPRGATALLDAIGRCVEDTGKDLSRLNESDRPAHVIVVILTDGEENSSRTFNMARINDTITHQRDVYNWQFVFLGANQDAIAAASRIGIKSNAAMTYASNSAGVQAAFSSTSNLVAAARSGAANPSYTPEDRKAQDDAGAKPKA